MVEIRSQGLEYPVLVWPKPLAPRAHSRKHREFVVLYSYSEGLFLGVPHIARELRERGVGLNLDGFLVSPNVSGAELEALATRSGSLHSLSETVCFCVYDYVSNEPAYERSAHLVETLRDLVHTKHIRPRMANNFAELQTIRKQHLDEGSESSIVKNINAPFRQNWTYSS